MSLLDSNYTFEDSDIDIISFGELLIDLITKKEEVRLSEAEQFSRYFGGSAANVAVNSQRLGAKTRLLTRIGNDEFGDFLLSILKRENVLQKIKKHDVKSNLIAFKDLDNEFNDNLIEEEFNYAINI